MERRHQRQRRQSCEDSSERMGAAGTRATWTAMPRGWRRPRREPRESKSRRVRTCAAAD